jgi:hypothetical protein
MAQSQDYAAFYRQNPVPPGNGLSALVRLINLRLESNSESRLRKYAQALEARVQGILKQEKKYRERWMSWDRPWPPGPAEGEAPLPDAFKGGDGTLHEFTEQVIARIEQEVPARGVKLIVDVDPVHML